MRLLYIHIHRVSKPWLWCDFLFSFSSYGKFYESQLRIIHNFTEEGQDTTCSGITFILYCIGLYPHVQKKIHDELDAIFGDDRDGPITFNDVREMKYLECVIKESHRLYPPVPFIGRKLNEDIKYNRMVFPKDTNVYLNILGLHRRADNFPNPEVFDPERFTVENIQTRHPYAYIPFGAGPRTCIGQKLALLEEKVVVGHILRQFDLVSMDPRDRVHIKCAITLQPAQPIRVKVIPRE